MKERKDENTENRIERYRYEYGQLYEYRKDLRGYLFIGCVSPAEYRRRRKQNPYVD